MPRYEDYHRTVIGFHGTTHSMAQRIVTGDPFRSSQNEYDWLGHGIYFWEHAPQQAFQWARQRYKKKPIAVLGSMIRLGNCFDLLDPRNAHPLLEAKKALDATLDRVPRNHNAKEYLDCAVFEAFYQAQAEAGQPIDSARAVYVPTDQKKRLWDRSWLFRETHVQLCVREPACILGTWLVQPMKEDA